jgi:hypothetical protein
MLGVGSSHIEGSGAVLSVPWLGSWGGCERDTVGVRVS